MEIKKSKLSCSFCGKKQSQVKKLIAGPNIYICNECVDFCNDILVEEETSEGTELVVTATTAKSFVAATSLFSFI